MKIINLLPKTRQQELSHEAVLRSLLFVVTLTLVSFGLVILAQLATRVYLQAQANTIKGQIASLQQEVNGQQNTDVKTKVQGVNNLINDYNNLANSYPKWSKVLVAFAKLPPSGLVISSMNIDTTADSITINGQSPTRDLVIELYNNILDDTAEFYNVDYPLENIVSATNVNFHFTFYIQSSLLK